MPLTEVTETRDNLDVKVELLDDMTVLSGENVSRGDVVARTGRYSAAAAVAGGSNTGNGTVSGETANDTAMAGTYTLTCTAAAADSGTFKVVAPDGTLLEYATVAVPYDSQIGFTIADGATDFIVGDTFTIVVTEGEGKLKKYGAGDEAFAVMYSDTDASAGDVIGKIYRKATLNAAHVAFGTGSRADAQDNLDANGIYLVD